MRHLWARGFGRLFTDAEVHQTAEGKSFLLAVIEFEGRKLANGKPYAQRVQFRSFDPLDIEIADQLIAETLRTASAVQVFRPAGHRDR